MTEFTRRRFAAASLGLGMVPFIPGATPLRALEQPAIEQYFLPDGGTVILSPFLPTLFERLGLLDGTNFASPASAERAAQVLHYAATGSDGWHDSNASTSNVMCGLEPIVSKPEQNTPLDQREIDLADIMIAAVISNWEALGTPSPAGLRESFLVREALLTKGPESWRLMVESKSIDVLLDRLPWPLAKVWHPWMGSGMNVIWRA